MRTIQHAGRVPDQRAVEDGGTIPSRAGRNEAPAVRRVEAFAWLNVCVARVPAAHHAVFVPTGGDEARDWRGDDALHPRGFRSLRRCARRNMMRRELK
jgi:hypothetical protein